MKTLRYQKGQLQTMPNEPFSERNKSTSHLNVANPAPPIAIAASRPFRSN
jgi:hypothetical protein